MPTETGSSPSAQDIFEPLVRDGEAELQRSTPDLIVSGLIAGLDIGFGPLALAMMAGRMLRGRSSCRPSPADATSIAVIAAIMSPGRSSVWRPSAWCAWPRGTSVTPRVFEQVVMLALIGARRSVGHASTAPAKRWGAKGISTHYVTQA